MNDKIICICYSRTGKTGKVMTEIASALDCELVFISDRVNRQGKLGALRCGLDAMRVKTKPLNRIKLKRALSEYELVILGTPVWAGRCSSVMRGFLKRRGFELHDVAYVITHASEAPYRFVFDQMDRFLLKPRVAEVSFCPGAAGYVFWRDQFLKTIAERTGVALCPISGAAGDGETED